MITIEYQPSLTIENSFVIQGLMAMDFFSYLPPNLLLNKTIMNRFFIALLFSSLVGLSFGYVGYEIYQNTDCSGAIEESYYYNTFTDCRQFDTREGLYTAKYGTSQISGNNYLAQSCNVSSCSGATCTTTTTAFTSCAALGGSHSYTLVNSNSIAPSAVTGGVYIQNYGSSAACSSGVFTDVHYIAPGVCDQDGVAPQYTLYSCGTGAVTIYNCQARSGPDVCPTNVASNNCTVFGTHNVATCVATASGNYAQFYCNSFNAINAASQSSAMIIPIALFSIFLVFF